ncbi:MAG TPA: GIY-YIG nuclease family protein [Gammaproteobacteria bacterium]
MDWHLYILDCDGRFYTGIAKDPGRRLEEHRAGNRRGAKFTRGAGSHELVYAVAIGSRSLALRAEARVKKLSRLQKEDIVRRAPSRDALLSYLSISED